MQQPLQPTQPWTYQPPRCPKGAPQQRYYREQSLDTQACLPTISLLRFVGREHAKLSLRLQAEYGEAEFTVTLPRANLLQLRDALNDALHEIEQEDQERLRAQSFQQICDELNEAEATGHTPLVHYCHPDVHYVEPGREDETIAQLQAAGATRYMVLTRPAASLAACTPAAAEVPAPPPYPHRPAQWPEGLVHLPAATVKESA